MKKTVALFCTALLTTALSINAYAVNELQPTMRSMGKSLSTAEKSDDLTVIKKELTVLHESALQAQKVVPDHLKNQPADSAERKLFTEGITKLLAQIDVAQAAANKGNLEETKLALENVKAIRNEYHKKLKP
ncbi:MAG: cytochrome b562 [Formivibrio sp.]|nr:cytochrome b562 [Formivibrio sp.]